MPAFILAFAAVMLLAAPVAWLQPREAVVSGHVVRAHDGGPVRMAEVALRRPDGTTARIGHTGDDGAFTIEGVPPGRYALRASAPGYVGADWSPHGSAVGYPFFALRHGDRRLSPIVRLARGGVIAGRVMDARGWPLAGVAVHAFIAEYRGGREVLRRTGQPRTTDDRGLFRLFGLDPATYYVAVRPDVLPAGSSRGPGDLVMTFHPGTPSIADAQPVVVEADREAAIGDLVVSPTAGVTIAGTVVDAQGRPAAGVELVVVPETGPMTTTLPTAISGADGRFAFGAVAPGRYVVQNLPDPARPAFGSAILIASGSPTLTLQLRPPQRARAVIVTEDDPLDFEPRAVTVRMEPADRVRSPLARGARARVADDWTVEIANVWGPQRLHVSGPDGWMLKRIDVAGEDRLAQPIDLRPDLDVRLVLTRCSAAIAGTIADHDRQPLADAPVLVYAADASRWRVDARSIRLVRADADGRFVVRALPAGNYLVTIPGDPATMGWPLAPALLEMLRATATTITAVEGREQTINLALTPRER